MRLNSLLKRTLVASLSLLFACSVLSGMQVAPGTLRADSRWWQRASGDEQRGFIYGYQDCRQPAKVAKASITDYQNAVSETLKAVDPNDPKAVTKAIEHAWTTLPSRDITGGEIYSERHGYLDGDWWGGFDGPWPPALASADRGYVEGYLMCSSAPVTSEKVGRYQAEINRHYASGQHDRDKIAVVLERLRKRQSTTQK